MRIGLVFHSFVGIYSRPNLRARR